ncbi:hypothetical protein DEO72_LG10g2882 [Vigna unguiculata]|uniref:Knottin n=1 Tax=Vigna unguiculata TaxID=3917 RepID=A0A4D6ND31_VIGUN|nr:hypothetical protein DEO72_LG10g2881 [Vigna unguiculata]QCE11647.1 hypothetical protein DEO72_LG10g2882 [Vigna unguiculata]
MASRFSHPFLFGLLFAALVLIAGTRTVAGTRTLAGTADVAGTADKGPLLFCFELCYPGCHDECLKRGYKEGFCFQENADYSCCCRGK